MGTELDISQGFRSLLLCEHTLPFYIILGKMVLYGYSDMAYMIVQFLDVSRPDHLNMFVYYMTEYICKYCCNYT